MFNYRGVLFCVLLVVPCVCSLSCHGDLKLEPGCFFVSCFPQLVLYVTSIQAERNRNLMVIVADTRLDLEAGLGRLCCTYTGPPKELTKPVNLTCHQPTLGRFVQIKHAVPGHALTLCELDFIPPVPGHALTLCEVDFIPPVIKQPGRQTDSGIGTP